MGKLEKIMKIADDKERQDALVDLGKKVGVTTGATYSQTGLISEPILVERIRNATTARLASQSWWLALAACTASVLSAIAAWVAVLLSKSS